MSEQGADAKPAGTPGAKPTEAAAAGQGGAERTPFTQAQELLAKGLSRADILAQLKAQGMDDESAKVVLNSLPGAPMPPNLPEASLELGINPLSPKTVALSDLGMHGEPRTVGVYYMAFGVVLVLLSGLALLAGEAELLGASSKLSLGATRVGLGVGFTAIAYGLFRVVRR